MAKKKKHQAPAAPRAPTSQTTNQTTSQAAVVVAAPPQLAAVAAISSTSLRPVIIDAHLLWKALAVAAAAAAVWAVRGVLITLLFVAVLTFLGAPIVDRLERRRLPRGVGALVVVLGLLLAVTALFALVLPPLVSDLARLVEALPDALKKLATAIEQRFGVRVPLSVQDLGGEAAQELLQQVLPFAKGTGSLVGSSALGVVRGAGAAVRVVLQALLVPIISFFVLVELKTVRGVVKNLVPTDVRAVLGYYLPLIDATLSKLVRGQLVVASVMGVAYTIGLVVSGVPFALAIGLLAGAAYFVPFASAAVALVLSVAFSLLELQGGFLSPLVGAAVTCVVVQLLEGYVLTPRIVGEQAGLSPLAALLAVLLGGTAGGFLGVLFALPTGAVVALVLREEARRRADPGPPTAAAAVSS